MLVSTSGLAELSASAKRTLVPPRSATRVDSIALSGMGRDSRKGLLTQEVYCFDARIEAHTAQRRLHAGFPGALGWLEYGNIDCIACARVSSAVPCHGD